MCICNLDNPVDFMNEIVSEDQREPINREMECSACGHKWISAFGGDCPLCDGEIKDTATAEGHARLDAAIAHISKLNRAKLAMFDDMAKELEDWIITFNIPEDGSQDKTVEPYFRTRLKRSRKLLAKAKVLQKGELP